MKYKATILVAGIIFWGLVSTGAAQEAKDNSRVLAEIGNQKITLNELRQKEPARLLNGEYELYLALNDSLQKVVDQHLLENEAHKQNITVTELYDRNVKSKIKAPSEADLKLYYDTMGGSQPFDSIRQKLLDRVLKAQEQKLLMNYVASLRAKEHVQVLLKPPREQVALGKAPVIGEKDAPITIIEFADFECPYCRQVEPDLQKLQQDFPGKLKLAYKDFPLPSHPHAQKAAEAAFCAGEQGQFWPYHDRLYKQDPDELEVRQLKEIAASLKLDTAHFNQCLDSGQATEAVKRDAEEGARLGVNGTPSFFINGYFLSGAVQYDTLRDFVEEELASPSQQASISGNVVANSTK